MELVQFSSPNPKYLPDLCPAYMPSAILAATDVESQKLGVVVVQEWWGVNDNIKNRALDLYQKYGWITLVPDLYRGHVAIDHETAHHLMTGLDFGGAVQDIQAAAQFLKREKKCEKVAVVGFCMGGALCLLSATVDNNAVDATCAYYGIPPAPHFDIAKVNVPVMGHFGNLDKAKGYSAPEDVDRFEQAAKDAGIAVDLYRYEDADHAFDHFGGPNYHKEASEAAEKRTAQFFNSL